jgi:predicted RNA-binding Zn ribbon-like protein
MMSAVPASDPGLLLAIDFVNTYDLLESPPDRLTASRAADIARRHGYPGLADRLAAAGDRAVTRMRALRGRLYLIFAAAEPDATVATLNAALDAVTVRPHLGRAADGGWRLRATYRGDDPVGELAAVVTDALAFAMATGGPARFRTCVADPCRCVYVDRTRAGRQRFCCELCNDRVAAAAYRDRRSQSS